MFCAIKCHSLMKPYISKYQMTDGKQEICPQQCIEIKALFSLNFYRFYTRRSNDLEIDLSISFGKTFEGISGDRLVSYSVMQDKHIFNTRVQQVTGNIITDNLNTRIVTRDHPV